MATNERGHTVPPATGESPTRAGIFGTFNTINDIMLCSSEADRTAKIAALSYTPSPSRPAMFWRADAPAGRRLESWDGSNIHVYDGRDSGLVAIGGLGTNCEADATLVPYQRKIAGEVRLEGRINISPALAASGTRVVCQLSPGYRPPTGTTRVFSLTSQNNRFGRVLIADNGQVTVEVNPTGDVSNVYLDGIAFRGA